MTINNKIITLLREVMERDVTFTIANTNISIYRTIKSLRATINLPYEVRNSLIENGWQHKDRVYVFYDSSLDMVCITRDISNIEKYKNLKTKKNLSIEDLQELEKRIKELEDKVR